MMIGSIVSCLLIAWFLSWFGVDSIFIKAINELTGRTVTEATYYFVFFIIGLILSLKY